MANINFASREVNCKIVYYGPGRSGKTTNLEIIHQKAPKDSIGGEMVSIATETDRTLFFDFLPLDLGTVAGMRTKFQLYTVPGQVYYNATRKLVLQGADGVVFVADSQTSMHDENLESIQNLEENLRENGIDINSIPLVFQWNKRDLDGIDTPETLNDYINRWSAPAFEAVAVKGEGVFATLKAVASVVIKKLNQESGGYTAAPAPAPKPAATAPVKPAPALATPAAVPPPAAAPKTPAVPKPPVTPAAQEPPPPVAPVGAPPPAPKKSAPAPASAAPAPAPAHPAPARVGAPPPAPAGSAKHPAPPPAPAGSAKHPAPPPGPPPTPSAPEKPKHRATQPPAAATPAPEAAAPEEDLVKKELERRRAERERRERDARERIKKGARRPIHQTNWTKILVGLLLLFLILAAAGVVAWFVYFQSKTANERHAAEPAARPGTPAPRAPAPEDTDSEPPAPAGTPAAEPGPETKDGAP